MSNFLRPKTIYLAQRHARYSPQAFTTRWRQHGALGMSLPSWHHVALYLHCDPITGLPAQVHAIDCDAVGVVVYPSERSRQARIAAVQERRILLEDELETFAQPVARRSLPLHEHVELPAPHDGYRLFVFWSSEGPGFGAAWDAAAARSSSVLAGGEVGFVRNRPSGSAGEWQCAGVDELVAARPERLCELAQSWERDSQLPGVPRMVLTRTVVLYDQPTPP